MDLSKAKDRFNEIAEKTGILSRAEQKVEPTHAQRDELWDITRVFAERIYKLDIDKNANQNEINELSHFVIVALHWNDLYLTDDRFPYDNGRFRRDTVALAMCFFTRISRDYKQYDSLKNGGCFFWVHRHFMNILIVGANYLNGLDRMMMTARQVNRITKTKLTVRSK